jgi:ABC-type sugar transport system ATPase subunit
MECGHNITLSSLESLSRHGVIRLARERGVIADFFGKLRVKAPSPQTPAQVLSGGNQQKLVLAKWLACQCRILLLDEPTRGVDVGAKAEIHRLIDELAAAGQAILMISSELPEVLNISTRVLVMRNGRVAGVLERAEATQERVMQLMAGQTSPPAENN